MIPNESGASNLPLALSKRIKQVGVGALWLKNARDSYYLL
jgi:hypothetical protein